jgi:hypothetical protein
MIIFPVASETGKPAPHFSRAGIFGRIHHRTSFYAGNATGNTDYHAGIANRAIERSFDKFR